MNKLKNKQTLLDDCCDEVLEEAWGGGGSLYGGAPGGGSGTFAHTQTAGAKTWSPGSPPHRAMTGSPGGLNTKDLGEESEDFAKTAGKNLPFPLDQVFDHLVDAYVSLENAKSQLATALKYNKVLTKEKEKKALLDHSSKKLDQLSDVIKNVSYDIDRLTMG